LPLLHQFIDRAVGLARRFLEAAAQAVGQERPGRMLLITTSCSPPAG
jgi:hypothetical protein